MDFAEQTEEPPYTCRVCFDGEHECSKLVSPCSCTGTQQHVHLSCLRRWQESVQKLDQYDERAFRCSVCRSLFTITPPLPKASIRLLQALRGIGGAVCMTLLAFGLSGPPWPHLALLVLLLLGTRSHSLLVLALLLVGSLLAALHARGLRVVMRVDGAGRLGLAVIRHGAPVHGLGPGVLLVASQGLDHTLFRESVVLLFDHGRTGARGVILTQALTAPPAGPGMAPATYPHVHGPSRNRTGAGERGRAIEDGDSQGASSSRNPEGQACIRHFLGGPVGMPGEGVHQEMILLHTVAGVPGSNRVPLGPVVRAPTAAARGGSAAARQPGAAAPSGHAVEGEVPAASGAPRPAGPPATNSTGAAGASTRRALAAPAPGGGEGSGAAPVAGGPAAGSGAGEGAGAPCDHASTGERGPEAALFVGGTLAEVLERAGAEPPGGGGSRVHVYHGVCAWAEGQLEGEMRSGAWELGPATLDYVMHTRQGELWRTLKESGQLVRPAQ